MYMSVCVCERERERESLYIPRKVDASAATRRRHTSCGRLRAGLLHTLHMRVCVCVCVCLCVLSTCGVLHMRRRWTVRVCGTHGKVYALCNSVCVYTDTWICMQLSHTRQNATWKCHTAHTHTHLDCVYVCVCVHIPQSSMDMHTDHTHTHASAVCERVALAT